MFVTVYIVDDSNFFNYALVFYFLSGMQRVLGPILDY